MNTETLRELRAETGLTQAQCARMCHAGLRTWKHWEAGTRAMPRASMELWCLAVLVGGHRPIGGWCVPWVRSEFVRRF